MYPQKMKKVSEKRKWSFLQAFTEGASDKYSNGFSFHYEVILISCELSTQFLDNHIQFMCMCTAV